MGVLFTVPILPVFSFIISIFYIVDGIEASAFTREFLAFARLLQL